MRGSATSAVKKMGEGWCTLLSLNYKNQGGEGLCILCVFVVKKLGDSVRNLRLNLVRDPLFTHDIYLLFTFRASVVFQVIF